MWTQRGISRPTKVRHHPADNYIINGRDQQQGPHHLPEQVFQSTRPRGRDYDAAGGISMPEKFQSTRPRGRDVFTRAAWSGLDRFQSTRPRGRDIVALAVASIVVIVSIHAPARARPPGALPRCRRRKCFNPRARAGATGHREKDGVKYVFQSTRPRGRDHRVRYHDVVAVNVSIHAPARARLSSLRSASRLTWFQSTRPRGRDYARGPNL